MQQMATEVESNLGPLREDTASVYGAPALPTEPPGAPGSFILQCKTHELLTLNTLLKAFIYNAL